MARNTLDIIICTYNNARLLDLALSALARQSVPSDVAWGVLIVDNNCTDDTRQVITRHRRENRIPDLRGIREREQGLTPARLAGAKATKSDWIAFVDDDNILNADWVVNAVSFATANSVCAAFGGNVTLKWECDPETWVQDFGYAYAEQKLGDEVREVSCLVGAGMVIRRKALDRTGWLDGPLLDDRVGRKLVSGGDVELALRLSPHGQLFYTPDCRMDHFIPSDRNSFEYLARVNVGLGVSKYLGDALLWRGGSVSWFFHAAGAVHVMAFRAMMNIVKALVSRRSTKPAQVRLRFALGYMAAFARMMLGGGPKRRDVLGRAGNQISSQAFKS